MNWVCICGTLVSGKRFCPKCQHVRFRLDRTEFLDYFGPNVGRLSNGLPFNLPINYLASHLLFAGQTGTGKTRFAMNLAVKTENSQSGRGLTLLVVDVEGEWKGIIPKLKGRTDYFDVGSNLRINPFDLEDPALVRELMRETVFKGIEKEYVDLSAQMNFVLQETIAESRNMEDLIRKIQNYDGRKLTGLDKTKTALLVRLDPFMRSPLKEIFLCNKSNPDFKSLGESNAVIDLHTLDSRVAYGSEIRLIYNTITTYFLRKMLGAETTDLVSHLFVADEAQLLVPRILHKIIVTESWPATEFATRLRKRGCGLVLITQSPSNIEKDILKNTAAKIIFRLQSGEDIKLISESAGFVHPIEYQYLLDNLVKLSQKQAIVVTDTHDPFLIVADDFEPSSFVPDTSYSDEIQSKGQESQSADTQYENTNADEEMFLQSIKEQPFIGVADRRSRLGWDDRKYSSIVESLQIAGLIEKTRVTLGKGGQIVLYKIKDTVPSIKHEFYVNWIAEQLTRMGIDCIKSRIGPDIQIPSLSIAINVELGSSDILSNIEESLKQYRTVVVCSDDKNILDKLIPDKRIVLALIWNVAKLLELRRNS